MRRELGTASRWVVWTTVILAAGVARADDAFYIVPIADLKITEGALPERRQTFDWRAWQRQQSMRPYAVIDGEGEAYLPADAWGRGPQPVTPVNAATPDSLAIRAPAGVAVRGRLYLPKPDFTGMEVVKFTVSPRTPTDQARKSFYAVREQHYRNLAAGNRPGAAWFRHQTLDSRRMLDGKPKIDDVLAALQQQQPNAPDRGTQYEDTFQVFSGGRAVSENLQLDRLLRPTTPAEETVALSSLAGITVAEMDWGPMTKDVKPEADPLASLIPADQHAIFLPTFKALTTMIDEADAQGTPALEILQQRSEDLGSRQKYQTQLCLEVNLVSRLLGDKVIGSVAFTGGDPYLRTGTDVAVLFETSAPPVLSEFLAARHAAAAAANKGCQEVKGTIAGVAYFGAVTPDRRICSYRATLGNAVVVTNSLAQLERLIDTAAGKEPSLASLPEYAFFRNRYPRDSSQETAFLIVTDATIRRWCGPKWRIATSRRTRAAAVMMHLQAARFDELVAGKAEPQPLQSAFFVPDMGPVDLTRTGVVSATYGSLEFQTPIGELDLAMITQDEADSYQRWRDTYQQNWRQFFDPIAVSFSVQKGKLAADMTVMPLIASTDYRRFIEVAGNAKLAPNAGDRHAGTLLHWALAIDAKSPMMQQANGLLGAFVQTAGGGPLGWLGESIAVYADADPYWLDLAKVEKSKQAEFFQQNAHRLPVAFQAEVGSPLRLAAFLTAVRAFVEQSAPNLTTWETKRHNEQTYVSIRPTAAARRGTPVNDQFAIHYAPTPASLVVTLNEDLLKRALDREAAAIKAEEEQKPVADSGKAWLGDSLALQLDRSTIDMLAKLGEEQYQQAMQSRSWANLAILNEWKRRYPKQDPVALNERYWQALLVCPGGGRYVWNDQYQTMESTVYGHPGQPKTGPTAPAPLRDVKFANFGVTFENQGLRARMELDKGATP